MSDMSNGGPAFPVPHDALIDEASGVRGYASQYGPVYEGMSLRDYFAAKAMSADIGTYGENWTGSATSIKCITERSYKIADAMLAAREAR